MSYTLPQAPDKTYDASNERQTRRSLEITVSDLQQAVRGLRTSFGALSLGQSPLTLANGANNDVAVGTSAFIHISGPSGSFSITGILGGEAGRYIVLRNSTAQQMTIANQSASSSEANRIITATGADLVLTGSTGQAAHLVYDAVTLRWIVVGTHEGSDASGGIDLGIDLEAFGLALDGTTDDTTAFEAAITAANTAGHNKLICPVGKQILLKRAQITYTIDLNMNGSALVADFKGALQPDNCTTILKAPGGYAKGVLTFSGVGTAADTITVAGKTYTLRASVATTANEVLIGASATATAQNLRDAINTNSGAGTTYGSATVKHTLVRATVSGAVLTVTALTEGTAANSQATTDTSSSASWASATLTGGMAPVSITIRNAKVDGQNDGTAVSGTGEPLLHFIGGEKVVFDNVEVVNGGNRDSTVHDQHLEYTNAEVLIDGAGLLKVDHCKMWSSAGEILQVQSWDGKTIYQISHSEFDKTRSYNASLNYSNSSFNALNVHPSSSMIACSFLNHVKTAANLSHHGGTFISTYINGVSDSNGLDFNEAASYRFDGAVIIRPVIRGCVGAGIRTSGSNVLIDGADFSDCTYGVMIEGDMAGVSSVDTWWRRTDDAALRNICIRNVTSRGSTQSTKNTIEIRGASSSLMTQVSVHGIMCDLGVGMANMDYGVNAKNCDLTVSGFFDDGDGAGIRFNTSGAGGIFKAVKATFDTQRGTAKHLLLLDALTMTDVVFEDCIRENALEGGASDIRFLNSPVVSGVIQLIRSDSITTLSSAAYPFTRKPNGLLSAGPLQSSVTIASGVATINETGTFYQINTEGAAGTDDLDTLSGVTTDGKIIVLRALADNRTVVCKDGTGNLRLASDRSLDHTNDKLTLIYDAAASVWCEISFADNTA
jgi:hypothetical protein